jgi:hypothetical protein
MTLAWALMTRLAVAEEPAVDIDLGDAVAEAKKPVWEPKGKALDQFLAADMHYRGKEWVQASRGFIEVLAVQPGCGKAAFRLAWALSEKGEHDDATTVIDALAGWFPEDKDVLLRAAQIHMRADQPAKAGEAAARVQERWPDDASGWSWGFRATQRNPEKAAALLTRARQTFEEEHALRCFDILEATSRGDVETATAALPSCKQAGAADLRKLADAYAALASGDWLTVQKYAEIVDDKALVQLAQILQRLSEGNAKGALLISDKLIAEVPSALDVVVARARAQLGAGGAEAALATLDALFADGWHKGWQQSPALVWARGPVWVEEQWRTAIQLRIDAFTAAGKPEAAQGWKTESGRLMP